MVREAIAHTRLEKSENEALQQAAKIAGVSAGEFIRRLIRKDTIELTEDHTAAHEAIVVACDPNASTADQKAGMLAMVARTMEHYISTRGYVPTKELNVLLNQIHTIRGRATVIEETRSANLHAHVHTDAPRKKTWEEMVDEARGTGPGVDSSVALPGGSHPGDHRNHVVAALPARAGGDTTEVEARPSRSS